MWPGVLMWPGMLPQCHGGHEVLWVSKIRGEVVVAVAGLLTQEGTPCVKGKDGGYCGEAPGCVEQLLRVCPVFNAPLLAQHSSGL